MGVDRIFLCTDFCTKENGKPLPDNCGSSTCGILSFIMFGILAVGTIAGLFPTPQTLGVEMLGSAPAIVGYVSVVLFIFAQGARKNSGFCVPLLKILMLMGGVVGIMLGSVHGISMDFAYGGTGLGVASFINWKGLKETIQYSSAWKRIKKCLPNRDEPMTIQQHQGRHRTDSYKAMDRESIQYEDQHAGGVNMAYEVKDFGGSTQQPRWRPAGGYVPTTAGGYGDSAQQRLQRPTSGAQAMVGSTDHSDMQYRIGGQRAECAPNQDALGRNATATAGGYAGYGPPRASQGKPTGGAHTAGHSPLQAMDGGNQQQRLDVGFGRRRLARLTAAEEACAKHE